MGPVPGLQCPTCGHSNPAGSLKCTGCQGVLSAEDVTRTNIGWSRVASNPQAAPAHTFTTGTLLAGRYEILQMLGQGGMGTVYKARDTELDRLVAIKIIRSELASDARTLARFKQELILARQITHKNVIRIFDLGTHEAAKFITMEFVEGQDLSSALEKRRFTPEESARTIRQICWALEAAHGENVVHRDLKPQNIMIDASGRVCVMDFGLARSVEMSGLTRTGALLGTPAYMSPEQVQGTPADQRSDLFSVGIIFYELLTGKVPFQADTVWASLLARTQTAPPPPIAVDPGVPQRLSDLTMKCLAIDRQARYGSAAEIVAELNAWLGDTQFNSIPGSALNAVAPPVPAPPVRRRKWLIPAAAVAGILAVVGGIAMWRHSPAPAPHPVSVLVADFTNYTGDPVFDSTLEPMFNVALEGASFINAFNRGQARRLARQLPSPTEKLDERSARLIAVSQGINAVITGEISRRGDHYSISTTALDGITGNVIAQSDVSASSKDEVMLDVAKLAASIRKALGDSTPKSVQLEATRGTFQAASLEAVHQYGIAVEQQYAGKMAEALQSFSKAVQLDPNFARAYAGMASSAKYLGRLQDAQADMKLVLEHIDRFSERERYRQRGYYYILQGDWPKCIEEYSALVNQYPSDNIGYVNLASCYSKLHDMPKAIKEARRAVELSPKDAVRHMNLSVYAIYAGDFSLGQREAHAALEINPAFHNAFLSLAYAQIAQGQLEEAAKTYRRLAETGASGASTASSGLADLAIYEGRFSDAIRIFQDGATVDATAGKRPDRAAAKLAALAYAELQRNQKPAAVAAIRKALSQSNAVKLRFLAARILVAAGEGKAARELANGLASEVTTEPKAYAKLIAGEANLGSDSAQAIRLFTEANDLLDTWIGRFDLGIAELEAGNFVEADSQFDRCIKRRGEAFELFVDDVPTYGFFPPVYYYQGRVREGLKSPGAADSYRRYLGIRGTSDHDPLLAEVRRRLGQ